MLFLFVDRLLWVDGPERKAAVDGLFKLEGLD